MQNTFSIREAISTGWDIFKSKAGFLVGLGFIIFVINIVGQLLGMVPIVGAIVSGVLSVFIGMGTLRIFLDIYDNKDASYRSLFSQSKYFWVYVGVSIITTLIVMGGIMLLIVPGIIASLALMFSLYLVIDRDMRVFEAIKTSWAITRGYRGKLFLLGLVLLLVNLAGLLALLFGLLVSIPVTFFAILHVYRLLFAKAEAGGGLPVTRLQTTPKVFMWLGVSLTVLLMVAAGVFFVANIV